MTTYAVKEVFYTLQGEGARTGRPAVFCRFSRCNLWSGRENDRQGATCQFCDTDFVGTDGPGGGLFHDAASLAEHVADRWPSGERPSGEHPSGEHLSREHGVRYVVCTGGEPLLQLDPPLLDALHERDFEIAIETNGTILVPPGVDWVCMSPKANAETIVTEGDELKLVFPQPGAEPERFESMSFEHFFLQPMAGTETARNTALAVEYCLAHPKWRLSLQTHKLLGIP